MKIEFEMDRMSVRNLFKLMLAGYATGIATLLVLLAPLSIFVPPKVDDVSGNIVVDYLVAIIALPLILIGHSVFLALLFKLGMFVYRKFGKLEFAISDTRLK